MTLFVNVYFGVQLSRALCAKTASASNTEVRGYLHTECLDPESINELPPPWSHDIDAKALGRFFPTLSFGRNVLLIACGREHFERTGSTSLIRIFLFPVGCPLLLRFSGRVVEMQLYFLFIFVPYCNSRPVIGGDFTNTLYIGVLG